jgi:peptidoglycan-N-acetylglucosamine deacetylase
LEKAGKGILLLHDIHRRTVVALPKLLAALKQRGFQIVHVIPTISQEPQLVAAPSMSWVGTP